MENLVRSGDPFNGFYKGKKVLITGHTGFKGSWLCLLLSHLGANVYGFALEPPTNPSLFNEGKVGELINSTIGDIRDYDILAKFLKSIKPEIVFHMAAQPLVLESYKKPIDTYSVNLMGTVNLLEAIRYSPGIRAVVNITTDKCYENKEWHWGYRENEPMGGFDPYSNSKGCSELVTSCFRNSYFNPSNYSEHSVALATARAGNVIGGGDWAGDRLIPDFIKSIVRGEAVKIRNPHAIRPWQHVLEPLSGYLTLAVKLYNEGPSFAEAWNFGPDDKDIRNVEWIVNKLCKLWGNNASYISGTEQNYHEATFLKLDCSKSKALLDWSPKWDIETTLNAIIDWNKAFLAGKNMREMCIAQINEYYS